MALFNIGDNVIRIDDNAHGVIIKVTPGRGRVIYTVNFDYGSTNVLETDLRANFDISDPFERCKGGLFGSYSDYSKINTTFKIRSSNKSTISSLKASKTLFRAYQFKPLLKFLNSPNRRLLVADEVGLGKTIEAGHVMLELKARKELKNVLIVCPKSLQEKWKAELYEKFGLTFKIYEKSKDLIEELSMRGRVVRGIVNYEKIRTYRDKDKNKDYTRTNLAEFLLSENSQNFSMVLCDEAHKMRNRGTMTYRGAEILMNCADTALFLTATPVMISDENLYNLLHLLDNTRYYNYEIFKNRMNENRPFVEAISNLNHDVPLSDIYETLVDAEIQISYSADEKEIYSKTTNVDEVYNNDPVFNEIKELLLGEDSLKARARLQYLLSTMSMMNTVFSRTRKREVTTDMSQAERKPHLSKVVLNKEEQSCFDAVIEEYTDDNSYTDDWGEERMTVGGNLGLVQRKRQVASSVWAYMNKDTDLDKGFDAFSTCEDAKVEKLLEIIKEVFDNGNKKLVVFALFRKTLKYLNIRLKKAGYNSLVIHGLVENRADILQQFKTDENIHILLSSEVGSEGLDMQFCNSMVNYDLPWNPMVVEQRIGRIDRFGQKSPVVNIYNMVVADSIQEEIYMRLLERIGIFQGTIGDMEAILDAQIKVDGKTMTIQDVYNKMEKEFYTKELTPQERERKMAEVERAIENEKENLQHLQEGLNNTLTNDRYFQEEIARILNRNAYVTKEELYNYLMSAIRVQLTTCNLYEIRKDVWKFCIPASQPMVLRNFLTQYCDNTDEASISADQFKRKIEDENEFLLTFNQDVAYENPGIHYLNIYHPMIQACLNYFIKNENSSNTTFSYALNADEVLQKGNRYYMGLYQLTLYRSVQGIKKETAELVPVLFNLHTGTVEENSELVDYVFRRSQIEGKECNATNESIDSLIIDNMNYDFTEYISVEKKKRLEEEKRQAESDRLRNEQQTKEYYKSRIRNHLNNIEQWEDDIIYLSDDKEIRNRTGAIRLAKAQVAKLEKERDERLLYINEDNKLGIKDKLLSLNLISIN
ncbi:MAG: DEAD/DEAH box helicase family protein [Bacteroidaceae bacterium]|nr:DEAD/DEAH box helicase family protein [Bacteroidaceae bacterium]